MNIDNKTVYSYGESVLDLDDLFTFAKRNGDRFVVTSDNSPSSLIKSLVLAEKYNISFNPGITFKVSPPTKYDKYLLEDELYSLKHKLGLKSTDEDKRVELENKLSEVKDKIRESRYADDVTVVALNNAGLKELVNLYSKSFENHKFDNYINKEDLDNSSENVLKIYNYYHEDHNDDNLYFIDPNYDKEYLIKLVEKVTPKRLIPTNKVLFAKKEDFVKYNYFLDAISPNNYFIKYAGNYNYQMSEDELYSSLIIIIGNKYKNIIDSILSNYQSVKARFSKIEVKRPHQLHDDYDELVKRCNDGFNNLRRGTKYENESRERLDYELSIIKSKNFSEYFINVSNIINSAKDLGILVGPGRGSGCGSEINYLLRITSIDPIKYNLYFERFINPGRKNFPDIDLDFATELYSGYFELGRE